MPIAFALQSARRMPVENTARSDCSGPPAPPAAPTLTVTPQTYAVAGCSAGPA